MQLRSTPQCRLTPHLRLGPESEGAQITALQLPRQRFLWGQMLIPGAGETTALAIFGRENLILARPLAPRQLVGYLDAIAVGVVKINADGDAVVGDAIDRDILVLEPLIDLL